jgi:2-polyprenyl-3-methyl-5-hydroxy-6-metoxy-1,4-benzoquinol methylase
VHLARAGSFDLVYSFAVLEHVRDVAETVRSIETVLRPGGLLVVPMHELRGSARSRTTHRSTDTPITAGSSPKKGAPPDLRAPQGTSGW